MKQVSRQGRGVVHLGGREHVHALHARRCRQRRAPRDEGHLRTARGQRSGDGVAHFARRVVRDEPHGVDGFDRGACRYDEAFTGQVLFFFGGSRGEEFADIGGDFRGFGHASLAREPAGELPFGGFGDPHAVSGQPAQVLLGRGVGVHVQIHGGGDDHRAAGREVGRQQQVVGDAACHFGQCIGRDGGDQVAVGPFAERDMGIPGSVLGVEELHEDRVSGERGHRQRGDELLGQRGHHDTHLGARRPQ